MDAGAEGSSGAEWLHGYLRRYGDVYVNQGEELAIRLFELEVRSKYGTLTSSGTPAQPV